jgi:hypothetical protein
VRVSINPNPAVAGERVRFEVEYEDSEKQAPFVLSVVVDGHEIHRFDCEDPPCYDMSMLLREEWSQRQLRARASAMDGNSAIGVFQISREPPEPLPA